jgi:hypothetical protein
MFWSDHNLGRSSQAGRNPGKNRTDILRGGFGDIGHGVL